MTSDGKFVGLTDETMGFGFVTYDCEAGVTCPGSVASTTTKPQVFSKFKKKYRVFLIYLLILLLIYINFRLRRAQPSHPHQVRKYSLPQSQLLLP